MAHKTQVGFLLAMVAATCLMQGLAISRATVPALDAVRFANSARSIDDLGFFFFLNHQSEPPLFPVVIWASHAILVAWGGEFREAWALSVQLAAALPLIVLPIPVYGLGKRLIGPYGAMFGTVLVLSLPELVRLGADGISDSTHLFWFAVALALLVAHLLPSERQEGRPWVGLLAGTATALAMLTRSEAAILAAAFALVLVVQTIRRCQIPWRSALPYAAGLATVFLPYGLLLGLAMGADNQTTFRPASEHAVAPESMLRLADGESFSFAPKDPTTSIRRRGATAAVVQLAEELPKTFGYVPGLLALVGFWILRRRQASEADYLLQLFCTLLLAAIVLHTAREGYLAARHMLPLAIAAVACIGLGAQAVGERLQGLFIRSRSMQVLQPIQEPPAIQVVSPRLKQTRPFCDRFSVSSTAIVLTTVIALLLASYGVRPLHSSRTGHRSAAIWLAQNACRGDRVVDTLGWTGLYSGLATVPYEKSRAELMCSDLRYLVVEDRELSYDSRRSRTIKRLLEQAGTRVATFPVSSVADGTPAMVLIYRWNASRCEDQLLVR